MGPQWLSQFLLLLVYILGALTYPSHTTDSNPKSLPARDPLPGLVTWDSHSLLIRGERLMLLSGEFHPFRLPVPDLWLDIFQKIKAMGFTGVSFYVDWGLLEGTPGTVTMDGIFSLEKFFAAASQAGIYLLARPGPFINAETSGGGYPGWIQRVKGLLRTNAEDYIDATRLYSRTIGEVIAGAQIEFGGPVILFQPENEYSGAVGDSPGPFPNSTSAAYMATVEELFREAGISVPMVDNDNFDGGSFRPGSGVGEVDIYGIDAYPMRYDCSHPATWPITRFYQSFGYRETHQKWSPSTPFSIIEFQGGSPDPWGGAGEDMCGQLINEEVARVVYKNLYSIGLKIFNLYMTFGGTNWGNLGHPGGYTSYDYGAAITEERLVFREKYSEQKLQGNFFKAVPAYLTATPGVAGNGSYGAPPELTVTPLWGSTNGSSKLYVVRHADFRNTSSTQYTLDIQTSRGNFTVPQLGGAKLVLNGRDSTIHVTDLVVGNVTLLYTTAEVYSIANTIKGQALLLYTGPDEIHELAIPTDAGAPEILGTGSGIKSEKFDNSWVVQWTSQSGTRRVLKVGNALTIFLLDRNEAYDIWPVELEAAAPIGNYSSPSKSMVIVKAGYLVRTAAIDGSELHLTGDTNRTTEVEIIAAPRDIDALFFNDVHVPLQKTEFDTLIGSVTFDPPHLALPSLRHLDWKYINGLPEIHPLYDDTLWTACNLATSNNPRQLTTPTSLYAGDYGYHAGSLLYRGHFTSSGNETTVTLTTQGGAAFAHIVYLDNTLLGNWPGSPANESYTQTFTFPALTPNTQHVITVLIDHMGNDENNAAGYDYTKTPRGILSYSLSSHSQREGDVLWKMTGNLHGENYVDKTRGPLNEGGTFAQRMGYHLPSPPSETWQSRNPVEDGVPRGAGVGFFTAEFDLDVPRGWDVPLAFVFGNDTTGAIAGATTSASASGVGIGNRDGEKNYDYRVVLFVNGYQFGKMVGNLGPQTKFPVPEGVLNYEGRNTVALEVWDLKGQGTRLDGLEIKASAVVKTALERPGLVPMPEWKAREGAY